MESKNNFVDLIYKAEADSRLREQTSGYQQRRWRGRINWKFGTDVYTLLYLTQITSKDLVNITGNLLNIL